MYCFKNLLLHVCNLDNLDNLDNLAVPRVLFLMNVHLNVQINFYPQYVSVLP